MTVRESHLSPMRPLGSLADASGSGEDYGDAAVNRQKGNEETAPRGDDPLWYKDAVIYELPVKAFADSNGDGIGDFPGLIQKLDYLQDLGVTALWLLPFYPSPLRDDGYDIADYNDINRSYGTRTDFRL